VLRQRQRAAGRAHAVRAVVQQRLLQHELHGQPQLRGRGCRLLEAQERSPVQVPRRGVAPKRIADCGGAAQQAARALGV
jgi:hypothetical protein